MAAVDRAALQRSAEGREWVSLLCEAADSEDVRQTKRRQLLRMLRVSMGLQAAAPACGAVATAADATRPCRHPPPPAAALPASVRPPLPALLLLVPIVAVQKRMPGCRPHCRAAAAQQQAASPAAGGEHPPAQRLAARSPQHRGRAPLCGPCWRSGSAGAHTCCSSGSSRGCRGGLQHSLDSAHAAGPGQGSTQAGRSRCRLQRSAVHAGRQQRPSQ